MITISSKGILDIKREEGERLTAYKDVAGNWTIGVGHLILPSENYLIGKTITPEESTNLLISDLKKVILSLNNRLKVDVSQNMIDSLAGFLFNAGVAAGDTLFRLINQRAGNDAIYNQWVNHYITAGGVKNNVLQARRIREANNAIGLTPINSEVGNYTIVGLLAAGLLVYSLTHKK